MIKYKQEKCDLSLIDCWKKIARERVKKDIDIETKGFRRGTKAIANLLMTNTDIRNKIINADVLKKSIVPIIVWIALIIWVLYTIFIQ